MASDTKYRMFNLLNKEFTFDVDLSKLPCGLNGAVYFSEMDEDGGMSRFPTNKAGAKYGTGYCDSQCPQDIKFINGEVGSETCLAAGSLI
jgi:cellulose 1,4-beta-cellobiosidase